MKVNTFGGNACLEEMDERLGHLKDFTLQILFKTIREQFVNLIKKMSLNEKPFLIWKLYYFNYTPHIRI